MIPVVGGSNPLGHPTSRRAPAKWSPPLIPAQATAAEAFALLAAAALAQIEANAAHVGRDPEYLHQLRVGIRRLRSALRAFRRLLKRRRAAHAVRPLKRIMKALGQARDCDVVLEMLGARSVPAGFLVKARQQQAQARKLAMSPQLQQAQERVRRWLRHDPFKHDARLGAFAREALEDAHCALLERAEGIDWNKPRPRHEVRIAVKRLRYACDFFAPLFRVQPVRPYLGALMSLQDRLGELNDIAMARRLVKTRALDSRERRLIAALGPAWSAFVVRRPFWRGRGRTPRAAAT